MTRPSVATLAGLGASALALALLVVQNKHEHRRLTADLEQQRAQHDRLELEWSQLQLEEATLAAHARVESAARTRLGLVDPKETVIVTREQDSRP